MKPRSLNQIIAELNPTYKPQIQSLKERQSLIPGQIEAEEKGLEAKQQKAFGDILGGARRRGLGFSGIPLGEQAQYTATEFLPALARLRQSGREQQMSLQDAILGISERRNTLAQQLRQGEIDRAEQRRQFNENLKFQREQAAQQLAESRAARAASSGGGFSPSLGMLGGGGGGGASASMQQRKDGGFNFQNAAGKSISAAKYASATKQDIRDVLYNMGKSGDRYAQQLYNQLRNPATFRDFQKRPDAYKKLYQPIFWGT